MSCGLPLNGAMASAVNLLDDTHGGAGEQCAALYLDIDARVQKGAALAVETTAALDDFIAHSGKYIQALAIAFTPSIHALENFWRWSTRPRRRYGRRSF